MIADIGGYIWFVGLGAALLGLAGAIAYATMRRQKPGGQPNHAWQQAADESAHPEVARPEK